eukprot:g54209.t1
MTDVEGLRRRCGSFLADTSDPDELTQRIRKNTSPVMTDVEGLRRRGGSFLADTSDPDELTQRIRKNTSPALKSLQLPSSSPISAKNLKNEKVSTVHEGEEDEIASLLHEALNVSPEKNGDRQQEVSMLAKQKAEEAYKARQTEATEKARVEAEAKRKTQGRDNVERASLIFVRQAKAMEERKSIIRKEAREARKRDQEARKSDKKSRKAARKKFLEQQKAEAEAAAAAAGQVDYSGEDGTVGHTSNESTITANNGALGAKDAKDAGS